MTGAFVSNFLICSKSSSYLVPHFQDLPVHVRSHNGLDIVETQGWVWHRIGHIPRSFSFRICFGVLVRQQSLPLSSWRPAAPPVRTSTMYSMLFKLAHHFVKVFIMLLVVPPNYSHTIMQIVSTWAILQYLPCISCRNVSVAMLTPKKSRLYRYRPSGAAKVVMSPESGWSSTWWNAIFRSSLLKTFASEIACNVSSTVGTGCLPEDCTIRLSHIQTNANVSAGLLYGNRWVDPASGTIDFFNDFQFF